MPTLTNRRSTEPNPLLQALELPRAMAEFGAMIGTAGFILQAPRGDGSPVVVLPGFTASDSSTFVLRNILERLGHRPVAWGLGRNVGPTREIIDGVDALVRRLYDEDGRSDPARRVEPGRRLRPSRRCPPARHGPQGHHLGQPLPDHPTAEPGRRVAATTCTPRNAGVHRESDVEVRPRVPCRCRRPRSTRRVTASCPALAAPRRRPSSPRTWASTAATTAWGTTPWPSTSSPTGWHCPAGCCHGSNLREP